MYKSKNIFRLIMAAVLAIWFLLPLVAACTPKTDEGWGNYSAEQLSGDEVRYDVRGGKGYLRWAAYEGASGYNVYRAESTFGNYGKVNNSAVTQNRYLAEHFIYWCYKVTAITEDGEVPIGGPISAFSQNALIISPADDMEAVQARINEEHAALEKGSSGQFSDKRFAMLLMPGNYPKLDIKLGYYTTASGVGQSPLNVSVGSLYVSTKVLSNANATCTFWRGAENMTVEKDTVWAVSQATSLRRIKFNGNLALSSSGWSSGGFIANCRIEGTVDPGTQQQWFSRNAVWQKWDGSGSHNYVFSGCVGDTPPSAWTEESGRSTVFENTEIIAEKPYLVYDGMQDYNVFVPALQANTRGISWGQTAEEEGTYIPLNAFYVANERDTSQTLNAAVAEGYHLLFPPGHYLLEKPLEINRANTVVLGLGYATLEIAQGNADCAVKIGDVGGVRLADLLIEGGAYSKNMVVVGKTKGYAAQIPNVLSNIYLRIGGVKNAHTQTDAAMVINANNTIGDNFWIWRADHSYGIAWDDVTYTNEKGEEVTDYGNPVENGLVVEGDNVTCYALMVEHCRGYQTYWKGENGLTVMYQSETPYNVPSQSDWMSPDGKNGCASYKVAENVNTHRAYGIGIYLVNYSGVNLASAIEAPQKSGIQMIHLVICDFTQSSSSSTISNVINNYGGGVGPNSFRRLVQKYPNL